MLIWQSIFVADGGHNVLILRNKINSEWRSFALKIMEDINWFVLYTKSNSEQRVIKELNDVFSKRNFEYSFEPFCPESEYYYRQSKAKQLGKVYMKRPLFPCYVFVETDMPEKDFVKTFYSHFYESPYIIRLLRYGNSGSYALDSKERMRFEYLFRGKRCLEHSSGYMEGDKITVTAGPLMGLEGHIVHIHRRDQMAKIQIEMYGHVMEAKLALEIVNKA